MNYLKYRLYSDLTNPLFYVCTLILNIFCAMQFFLFQNFFTSTSINLHYFFSAIPYIGTIVIPLLCIQRSNEIDITQNDFFKVSIYLISKEIQFILILLPLWLVPLCVSFFGDVDFFSIFLAFFILILYGFCSCALCIFIESLIPLRSVAFIINITFLAISNFIHIFSQYLQSSLLKKAIQLFSFSWHFDAAGKGIFDTRDVLFYILISLALLFLSVFCIEKKKGKKYCKTQKIQIFFLITTMLFIFGDSRLYFLRKDFSKDKKFTVSEYSKSLMQNLQSVMNITYFYSEELSDLTTQARDIKDYLQEFCSSKNNIKLSIKNVEKNSAKTLLENYGIYGKQLPISVKGQMEYKTFYSAIIVEYAGKWEAIPFVIEAGTLEYDLTEKILYLMTNRQRIVNIVCANGMNLNSDYSYVVPYLNLLGFICNEIDASDGKSLSSQFSQESKLLLVLGSSKLSASQCAEIEDFILSGSNAFFAVSPYSADIENSWYISKDKNENLIKMLSKYGIIFSENICADISCSRITMQTQQNEDGSYSENTYTQLINYPLWVQLLPQTNANQGLTLFWPTILRAQTKEEQANNKNLKDISPYLLSSASSWEIEPDFENKNSLFQTNPMILNEKKTISNEQKQNVLALKLNGEIQGFFSNETRSDAQIIVIPDQYFVNSLMLGYIGGTYGDYRNLDFLSNQLLELNNEEELAAIQKKSLENPNAMYKTTDAQSFSKARAKTLAIEFLVVPIFIIACFVFALLYRKKYISTTLKKTGDFD